MDETTTDLDRFRKLLDVPRLLHIIANVEAMLKEHAKCPPCEADDCGGSDIRSTHYRAKGPVPCNDYCNACELCGDYHRAIDEGFDTGEDHTNDSIILRMLRTFGLE